MQLAKKKKIDLTGWIKRCVLFSGVGNKPIGNTGSLTTLRPSDLDFTRAGESMPIRSGHATDVDLTACGNPKIQEEGWWISGFCSREREWWGMNERLPSLSIVRNRTKHRSRTKGNGAF